MNKSLHWTQRVALVRHNLHSASRSGDFTFFKTLQAQGFVDGTNHVATLSATLGDEADAVLAGLDDLNASMAQIHEDAFKNVYNSLKIYLGENIMDGGYDDKSKIFVDSVMQKQMADHAIDKTTSSAISLIQQQPPFVQDTAASVWITGNTIIADSIEICLQEINAMETNLHDFIRLEESWNTVKASVGHAVSAIKGVFTLMTVEDTDSRASVSSQNSTFSGTMFRRLSNAFSTNNHAFTANSAASRSTSSLSIPGVSPSSRNNSVFEQPEYRTPNYLRSSVSSACPTSLSGFPHTRLSAIPPTPAALDMEVNPFDTAIDPFDNAGVPPLPKMPSLPDIGLSQAVM